MPLAAGRRVRPAWLPLDDEFAGVDAGLWWDAVAVDGELGARTATRLRADLTRRCGPVACAARGTVPRWYFLTSVGTAEMWCEPGTQSLGVGCRIGLPGSPTATAYAVRWEVPPRFRAFPPLVVAEQLRSALRAARAFEEAA